MHNSGGGICGRFRLGGGDGIERDEHGGIYRVGVVQECSDNLLDTFDVRSR
jgi:hypothetical protein